MYGTLEFGESMTIYLTDLNSNSIVNSVVACTFFKQLRPACCADSSFIIISSTTSTRSLKDITGSFSFHGFCMGFTFRYDNGRMGSRSNAPIVWWRSTTNESDAFSRVPCLYHRCIHVLSQCQSDSTCIGLIGSRRMYGT